MYKQGTYNCLEDIEIFGSRSLMAISMIIRLEQFIIVMYPICVEKVKIYSERHLACLGFPSSPQHTSNHLLL